MSSKGRRPGTETGGMQKAKNRESSEARKPRKEARAKTGSREQRQEERQKARNRVGSQGAKPKTGTGAKAGSQEQNE